LLAGAALKPSRAGVASPVIDHPAARPTACLPAAIARLPAAVIDGIFAHLEKQGRFVSRLAWVGR